jgi:hypothetical protein
MMHILQRDNKRPEIIPSLNEISLMIQMIYHNLLPSHGTFLHVVVGLNLNHC